MKKKGPERDEGLTYAYKHAGNTKIFIWLEQSNNEHLQDDLW